MHEDVDLWVDAAIAFGKSGDNKAQGLPSSLGLALYLSLDSSKKELVKRAMRAGEICLMSKAATANSEDSERAFVKKIMNIVALEPPVERIRRLVRLKQEAMTCERKKTETLREFLDRFNF